MNLRKPPDAPLRTELPKVANIPPPPPSARPNRAVHEVYAEEALKSAQRVIDMTQEIDRLSQELEEWRRRAMMAESEIKRLESREEVLNIELEKRTNQLTDERDSYRGRLNNLVSQFESAGAIILRCMEAARGQIAPMVNLTMLANDVEPEQKKPEPLPRAITAGPRNEEETKAG